MEPQPTPLPAFEIESRRARRVQYICPAHVTARTGQYDCTIECVSVLGLRLRGSLPVEVGSHAIVRADPLDILVRVVWRDNTSCAVMFEEPLSAEDEIGPASAGNTAEAERRMNNRRFMRLVAAAQA